MPYKDRSDQAASAARHYERNREVMIERAGTWRDALRERNKQIVREAKAVPCADCGLSFPAVCMDFDHAGAEKNGTIADLAHHVSTARLLAEIARCEVVCACCHRLRSSVERGTRDG